MFKIVQTIERGQKRLCTVPEKWENAGFLYWPKSKADKLILQGSSAPSSDWLEMNCVLKRRNLASYEEAEHEISTMMYVTDTDDDQGILQQKRKKAKVLLPKSSRVETSANFNEVALACLAQNTTSLCQESEQLPLLDMTKNKVEILENVQIVAPSGKNVNSLSVPVYTVNTNNNLELDEQFLLEEELSTQTQINPNQNEILQNQKTILQNQKIIIAKLASLSVELEEVLIKVKKSSQPAALVDNAAKTSIEIITQVDSLDGLTALEKALEDDRYSESLLQKLSIIYGSNGKHHGLNVAYRLLDDMFSRKLMTQCSWAGGSRGENVKVAFKSYKNIIVFFFKIVQQADNHFTLEECEQFFKNILKNSTRRSNLKVAGGRASTCKRRPKNLNYKCKSINETPKTSEEIPKEIPDNKIQSDAELEQEEEDEEMDE